MLLQRCILPHRSVDSCISVAYCPLGGVVCPLYMYYLSGGHIWNQGQGRVDTAACGPWHVVSSKLSSNLRSLKIYKTIMPDCVHRKPRLP